MRLRSPCVGLLLTIACGATPSAATPAPATPPPATPTPAAATPFLFPLAHCVMHSGSSSGGTGEPTRCTYDAECFARPGLPAGPMDGFVAIRCEDDRCTCSRTEARTDRAQQWNALVPRACDDASDALLRTCMATTELEPSPQP